MNANNVVMWVILQNHAVWDCFKTPILREILRIQNLHRVEHCAFSEVTSLCQKVGCARKKPQFHIVLQTLKSFLDAGLRMESRRVINNLNNVDFIHSNVQSSHQEVLLYVFEDNEAVIKMIIKGRSPTMRHVSLSHRVALDWLFDRINLDPKIQIKYIDTKNQLADILTKGIFTRDEWNHLLCLFNISHFSSINNLEAMLKRTPEDAGENRVTAKSKPMMNLVSRYSVRDPNVLASIASEKPGRKPNLKVRTYL